MLLLILSCTPEPLSEPIPLELLLKPYLSDTLDIKAFHDELGSVYNITPIKNVKSNLEFYINIENKVIIHYINGKKIFFDRRRLDKDK